MGKKSPKQDVIPAAQSIPSREIIQRLNFSYQASVFMANLAHSSSPSLPSSLSHAAAAAGNPADSDGLKHSQYSKRQARRRRRPGQLSKTDELGRKWGEEVRIVGKKATVRLDPSIKRTLCQRCSTVFIPGSTVSIRIKSSSSHKKAVVYTCLHCSTSKRIVAPPIASLASSKTHWAHPNPSSPPNQPASNRHPTTKEDSSLDTTSPSGETSDKKNGSSTINDSISVSTSRHPTSQPLFARSDAGHVVFRGDQVLDWNDDTGNGVFIL